MAATLAGRLRRLWLDVHLWIGVGLLVAIFPLSVSGALLVWHDSLDKALHPARFAVSGAEAGLPLSAYGAAAEKALGGKATLAQIRLPAEPGDPVVATGRLKGPPGPGGRPRNLTVWIDPPSARVLDVADTSGGVIQTLHRLHGTLMIPEIGRKTVGWLGWAMFVSCATGLWLWWPRNGAVLKALRWRRGPSKLFNLHHMIGFWICAPLAVLSLTGVYISFPQTSRALFGVAEAQQAPRAKGGADKAKGGGPGGRFAPPIDNPRMTFEDAAAAALAARPGAAVTSISAPAKGREPAWRVSLRVEGAKEPVNLQVADATGKAKADRGGTRDPVSRLMRQVHDGTDMGLLWQVIIFLGGVAPAVLSVTGLIMWLRRRARRLAMNRRLAEA
jgi:uncharacterized iron-regulated membrane protein